MRGRYERRVPGCRCHQALICEGLVSEGDLVALLIAIYLITGRFSLRVGSCSVFKRRR